MNDQFFIRRKELNGWLDKIAKDRRLIAPRTRDGILLFLPTKNSQEIAWYFNRPVMSLKEFFFPPTDRLFTIEKSPENQIKITETLPDQEQVIFGIRPCDARGLKVLDALFIETPPIDPYYACRREQTTLIGFACREPGETCFCSKVGVSMDWSEDVDLMLSETEIGFSVSVISEKGEKFLAKFPARMERRANQGNLAPQPKPTPADQYPLTTFEWSSQFSNPIWEQQSQRCLSCRMCAYVCPTCRCYDIRDEPFVDEDGQAKYERIRCWDSCSGMNYRKIAGGHNPRAQQSQRLENRIYCKFHYYPHQYGPIACTGCGRCVELCPVNCDITEILEQLIMENG